MEKGQCAYLTDRYGVSWQIVHKELGAMVQDSDSEKSERVLQALMQMQKIDLETLKQAKNEAPARLHRAIP